MKVAFAAIAALTALGAPVALAQPDAAAGEGIYQQRCAMCHASGVGGASLMAKLNTLEAAAIVEKMTTGTMAAMASGLTDENKKDIAAFLSKAPAAAKPAAASTGK